jgi:hypothetical protein
MVLIRNTIVYLIIFCYLSGCAASRNTIVSGGSGLTDSKVCRNYLSDKDLLANDYVPKDSKESNYIYALKSQVRYRSLNDDKCKKLASEDNKKMAQGILAVLAVAALAAAASQGGGGSSYTSSGYAWDAFYDEHYNLVWRCRDKSTGRFAYNSSCDRLIKSDSTWTGK